MPRLYDFAQKRCINLSSLRLSSIQHTQPTNPSHIPLWPEGKRPFSPFSPFLFLHETVFVDPSSPHVCVSLHVPVARIAGMPPWIPNACDSKTNLEWNHKNQKKKTKNGTKTYQNWRFDAWAVLDICHSVKPSGATQKMVRRTPTPVRSLRSRKIRWTRKPARSLSGVACCREVFRVSRRCTIKW